MRGREVGGRGEGDDGGLQASHREVDVGEGSGRCGKGLVLRWEGLVEGGDQWRWGIHKGAGSGLLGTSQEGGGAVAEGQGALEGGASGGEVEIDHQTKPWVRGFVDPEGGAGRGAHPDGGGPVDPSGDVEGVEGSSEGVKGPSPKLLWGGRSRPDEGEGGLKWWEWTGHLVVMEVGVVVEVGVEDGCGG